MALFRRTITQHDFDSISARINISITEAIFDHSEKNIHSTPDARRQLANRTTKQIIAGLGIKVK